MTKFSRRQILATSTAFALTSPMIARAQTRELRLGLITPTGHSWNDAALDLAEMIQTQTDGRLSMTVFHAGQLGNEAAMMQQLQSGALDMGIIQAAELGSRSDHLAAINAPYLVDSTEKAAELMRHPEVLAMFDVLPAETGTIGLGWAITGMRAVFSSREIVTVEDMNGMKLRINPTPVYRDFYQLLGAAPTPIPTPQVYDAMANGQVDGLEADLEFSWNQRFDQVSKSILRMNALFMPAAVVASGRNWQAMPEDDRALIADAVNAALETQSNSIVSEESGLIQNLADTGIVMNEVAAADREMLITEFDKIWQPKAPVIARLREIGAAL
ncbi:MULTISPECIES: TRAP transporter substrate-binding protein [unclassified Yoonia]|uniref:TRAP transporter substrate-binding protein n=1 Tax=unclassified Yoonia TaxID=2629118 RepID=UPI002AFE4664|nr:MULTISPECIES: TRAP transporter substrate-binding protein [unclassified Yoonia]